jgi:hypothetical protein
MVDGGTGVVYLPMSRPISTAWAEVSAPKRMAPAFSSTCFTDLKPGIGTVTGLRAQIQASAP